MRSSSVGRKRKEDNSWLPPYTYLSKGRYIHKPYMGQGKFGKEIVLCLEGAPKSEVWAIYEKLQQGEKESLEWLVKEYRKSSRYKDLSPRTKKDYDAYWETVSSLKTKNGKMGKESVHTFTPGVIRKYLDKRASQGAPIIANREVAFLSAVFSFGFERDLVRVNPCRGVRRNKETPKDHYVEDADYQTFYDFDKPWYFNPMMEIAYLCRMRKSEVLDLQKTDLLPNGLDTRRLKGSNDTITKWSPRLRAAIDVAKNRKRNASSKYLFADEDGQRITVHAFNSSWGKKARSCAEQNPGWKRFTFHDLKAKGVSDFEGDKQKASGHKSSAMVARYDRKKSEVEPTK